MNGFITTGTLEFLMKLPAKYPKETMILMGGADGALLYHETNGKTVFKSPRRYELVESTGDIKTEGFVVMNNIPVPDEGRPLFEHQSKNLIGKLMNQPGFVALRLLRPISSNTYIVMTVWANEISFDKWQQSNSFSEIEVTNGGQPPIFDSAPYTNKYVITEPF